MYRLKAGLWSGAWMTSKPGRLICHWFPRDFPMAFSIYEQNKVCGKQLDDS